MAINDDLDGLDYNPLTDRFIRVSEPRTKSYGPGPEYASFLRQQEEARMARISEEKRDAASLETYKERYEREQAMKAAEKARVDRILKRQEEKYDAIDLARERYLEKSALYRFFHRRLTDKRAEKMSTAQINQLYGGVEEEKGRSR